MDKQIAKALDHATKAQKIVHKLFVRPMRGKVQRVRDEMSRRVRALDSANEAVITIQRLGFVDQQTPLEKALEETRTLSDGTNLYGDYLRSQAVGRKRRVSRV